MADEDKAYTQWLMCQPCRSCRSREFSDPHHLPVPGLAIRSHDHMAISVCRSCHNDIHHKQGRFAEMSAQSYADWHMDHAQEQLKLYQVVLATC